MKINLNKKEINDTSDTPIEIIRDVLFKEFVTSQDSSYKYKNSFYGNWIEGKKTYYYSTTRFQQFTQSLFIIIICIAFILFFYFTSDNILGIIISTLFFGSIILKVIFHMIGSFIKIVRLIRKKIKERN